MEISTYKIYKLFLEAAGIINFFSEHYFKIFLMEIINFNDYDPDIEPFFPERYGDDILKNFTHNKIFIEGQTDSLDLKRFEIYEILDLSNKKFMFLVGWKHELYFYSKENFLKIFSKSKKNTDKNVYRQKKIENIIKEYKKNNSFWINNLKNIDSIRLIRNNFIHLNYGDIISNSEIFVMGGNYYWILIEMEKFIKINNELISKIYKDENDYFGIIDFEDEFKYDEEIIDNWNKNKILLKLNRRIFNIFNYLKSLNNY